MSGRAPILYHTELSRRLTGGAVTAFIPGSPERAARISRRFDRPEQLADHRGLVSFGGRLDDMPVLAVSTGMGGPSTEIVMQELAQVGIRNFIRVGTSGAIQAHIRVGDVIVTEAAVRLDGTSNHYAPPPFPAVADHDITGALRRAAAGLGVPHHCGITVSTASFYPGQERYDSSTGYVIRSLRQSLDEWVQLGALNYEMEAGAIFVIARAMKLKAGAVCGVLASRSRSEKVHVRSVDLAEERTIGVAIEAVRTLQRDGLLLA